MERKMMINGLKRTTANVKGLKIASSFLLRNFTLFDDNRFESNALISFCGGFSYKKMHVIATQTVYTTNICHRDFFKHDSELCSICVFHRINFQTMSARFVAFLLITSNLIILSKTDDDFSRF